MQMSFDMILGVSFGMEFVHAMPEADVPNSCIILDIACFRWIFEFV